MSDAALIGFGLLIYSGFLVVAFGIFFGLKMIAEAIRDKNRLTLSGEIKIAPKSDDNNTST